MATKVSFVNLKNTPALVKLRSVSRYDWLVVIAIIVYGCVFSWYSVEKHYGFGTFAFDLGVFNQAFHTTIFDGKLFYYTCELYLNPSGSYFASKFSPIMFIVLPFYSIYPSPETLLIFKSFVLASGAFPLYLLSREMIGSKKAGFMMALVYLLNPGIQSANSFDFQTQIFIPITLFSTYYFMTKRRWKLYFLSMSLGLMTEEHVAVIIFLMSIFQFLTRNRLKLAVQTVRKFHVHRPSPTGSALLATMTASASWFFIARFVRQAYPVAPAFLDIYKASDAFRVLGFGGDIFSLPFYILTNPQRAFEALSVDFQLKFIYVMFIFAPLLFFSLRSKLSIAVAILFVPFLLSNYRFYYTLGAHYPLYLVPLTFLAAIEGLNSLRPSFNHTESGKLRIDPKKSTLDATSVLRTIMIVTLIFIISTSPLSPLFKTFMNSTPQLLAYSQPYSSESYVETLHRMIGLVPPSASVLTQNNIFPHFSNRINAYVISPIIPNSVEATNAFVEYMRQQINLSDFVLLDSFGIKNEPWTGFIFDEVSKSSDFKAYAFGGNAILFMKHYNGSAIFVPNPDYEVFTGDSSFLLSSAQIVQDPSFTDKRVVFRAEGTDPGIFAYGPYVFLPPSSKFEITFELRFGNHSDEHLATIDVAEDYGRSVLCKSDIYGSGTPANVWINFTLTFSSTTLRQDVEFRVLAEGKSDIYFDRVIVRKAS